MEKLQLSEIAAAVGSKTPLEAAVNDICTDTRKLEPGCLFLALRGANFDGHQFVKKAIADGAVAAVTDQPIEGCPCIVVPDTGTALLQIAAYYRKKFSPILVGVTGSVGKTTTKEMIALVLSAGFETLKTQGNLNNENTPAPCTGAQGSCHRNGHVPLRRNSPPELHHTADHWRDYKYWIFSHRKFGFAGRYFKGKVGNTGWYAAGCTVDSQCG
jgi:hypothetical protein